MKNWLIAISFVFAASLSLPGLASNNTGTVSITFAGNTGPSSFSNCYAVGYQPNDPDLPIYNAKPLNSTATPNLNYGILNEPNGVYLVVYQSQVMIGGICGTQPSTVITYRHICNNVKPGDFIYIELPKDQIVLAVTNVTTGQFCPYTGS